MNVEKRRPIKRFLSFSKYRIGVSLGIRDRFLPPKILHSVGNTDFMAAGDEFIKHFVDIAQLKPTDKVLDVGCGTGRLARPLVKYLTTGTYDGFDIVASSINWCQRTYNPLHPNFNFHYTDLFNKMYNPQGKFKSAEYKFPFATASFDFAFLTSVFTHMLPADMENYLREISRALKPGGTCLITYFLLNEQSRELMQKPASVLNFQYELPGCRTVNADMPEWAIAYQEPTIRDLYRSCNLEVVEPIRFGKWCARADGLSYQDMIIARKI